MRIIWLGHASFLIETGQTRIVTDPFDASTGYSFENISADLVTVSHAHHDHNAVDRVIGNPRIISSTGVTQFKDIEIVRVPSFHDHKKGQMRGNNIIFIIKTEGLAVCHLGDLGHILTSDQLGAIGKIDVLLAPVGGTYTISADEALQIVQLINPRVTIPMHFKTPSCNIDLAPVQDFTRHFDRVAKLPYLELSGAEPVSLPEVVVLDYSYI